MKPEEIKNLIQQEVKKTISEMEFNMPLHAHTGIDSAKIDSDKLKPYLINKDQSKNQPQEALTGKIQLFDFTTKQIVANLYNWGISFNIGEDNKEKIWSEINLADFYLDAFQDVPQTIATGATATIIYNKKYVEKPTGAFDILTGQFKVVENVDGETMDYNSWNTPIVYLVSASVGINPTLADWDEYVDIQIVIDGVGKNWNRFYLTPGDITIATINTILTEPITTEMHIEIYNGSADSIDTNIADMGNITYYKIKQLK